MSHLQLTKFQGIANKAKYQTEITLLDSSLPFIAYVRFEDTPNRGIKPHEFHNIVIDALNHVSMIQGYVN